MSMVADDAKVVLVTGSSRGLGKAIALEMGKQGQKVVINYVSDGSKESADATVDEIKALGGDAVAVQADSKSVQAVWSESRNLLSESYLFDVIFQVPILRLSRSFSPKLSMLLALSTSLLTTLELPVTVLS